MFCAPCVLAPYVMVGPLAYIYTYLTNNIQTVLVLICFTILTIYLYKNPEFMNSLLKK